MRLCGCLRIVMFMRNEMAGKFTLRNLIEKNRKHMIKIPSTH